jgi:membrane-associated phospholipid phosphatase
VSGQSERFWEAVGWPGYPPQSRVIPALVVAGVTRLCGRREAAWQAACFGVVPVGEAVKHSVKRPRPPTAWLRFGRRRPKGSSFPSTHVATYTSFYGYTAIALGRAGGPWRWLAAVPLGLIALVGPSRIRDGDHWRSDVLAGYVIGGSWLGAVLLARHVTGGRRADAAAWSSRADTKKPPASISEPAASSVAATDLDAYGRPWTSSAALAGTSVLKPKAVSPVVYR